MEYLIIILAVLCLLWVLGRMSQQAIKRMHHEEYEAEESE